MSGSRLGTFLRRVEAAGAQRRQGCARDRLLLCLWGRPEETPEQVIELGQLERLAQDGIGSRSVGSPHPCRGHEDDGWGRKAIRLRIGAECRD